MARRDQSNIRFLFPLFLLAVSALSVTAMGLRSAAPARGGSPPRSGGFSTASAENDRLSHALFWTFGGKSQHGWYIYLPLIDREIGVDSAAATPAFAGAVARWQRRNGLAPVGVLDESTWMAMVGDLQSARLKNKHYADAESLVTVSPDEFYDPTRPEELREVERNTYAAYKRMVRAAASDKSLALEVKRSSDLDPSERFLKIISAFRSREYQDHLRMMSPNSGRAGLAINSPHFTGRALDLYVGGDPVSTKDENRALQTRTPVYRWLVKNAERFGFRPYFYEPWHWEYVR